MYFLHKLFETGTVAFIKVLSAITCDSCGPRASEVILDTRYFIRDPGTFYLVLVLDTWYLLLVLGN